jgi:hypothetical protein
MSASEMHMLNPTTNLQGKHTGIKDQSVLDIRDAQNKLLFCRMVRRGLLVAGLEEIVLNP